MLGYQRLQTIGWGLLMSLWVSHDSVKFLAAYRAHMIIGILKKLYTYIFTLLWNCYLF